MGQMPDISPPPLHSDDTLAAEGMDRWMKFERPAISTLIASLVIPIALRAAARERVAVDRVT